MKWYYQAAQKARKSQHTTTDGPTHRIYQHKPREKHFSTAARRQASTATQPIKIQKGRLRQLVQNHRYDVYQRQHNQAAYLSQQNEQDVAHPGLIPDNRSGQKLIRIVWLQQKVPQLPKALGLQTRFLESGMHVQVHQLNQDDDTPLEGELILMECFGMFEQEMMKSLVKIRFFTQAPLIVLTDNHTLDWSIRALHNGADAIFTINMPDDVIVARSNALLRRWITP